MELRNVWIIGQKELRDARRSRWLLLFGIAFSLLSLSLAWLGLSSFFGSGVAGFGRTAASLVNLVLLLVPLIGLTLGALAVAGERERGTLLCLLAQPVAAGEVLYGKFLGLSLALGASLAAGFGATGAVIAWRAGGAQVGAYLAMVGLAALLAMAALALGLLISCLTRSGAGAAGAALFAWLALAFLGDLGVMASALALKLDIRALLAVSLLNPLQAFKLAAVVAVRGGGEVLGPAGAFAADRFGAALLPIAVSILAAWIVAPLGAAGVVLRRRGAV
ncbi:MAG: ABC transporter permease [Deltaproteobacteria bacterium]|nr:ABC transporter permease [Deltaproteobacteria bacterium]